MKAQSKTRLTLLLSYLNALGNPDAVEALRTTERAVMTLRSLVDSWLEHSPNGLAWRAHYLGQFQLVSKHLSRSHLILVPALDGCALNWDGPGSLSKDTDLYRVVKLFADFVHESPEGIGACKTCERYFEKTSKRTTFCTPRCGTKESSRQTKHQLSHRKFEWLISELTTMRKKYSADQLLDGGFWKEEVIQRTTEQATKVKRKKLKKLRLSQSERHMEHPISARWLTEHLKDSGDCSDCRLYIAKVSKLLGHSF